jgi:hypothetical protein
MAIEKIWSLYLVVIELHLVVIKEKFGHHKDKNQIFSIAKPCDNKKNSIVIPSGDQIFFQ